MGKDALIAKLGFNINIKDWMLNMFFSQHIPYQFYYSTSENEIQEDEEESNYYAGGLFKIELIKLLD